MGGVQAFSDDGFSWRGELAVKSWLRGVDTSIVLGTLTGAEEPTRGYQTKLLMPFKDSTISERETSRHGLTPDPASSLYR